MRECFVRDPGDQATALIPVTSDTLSRWLEGQPQRVRAWVEATGFKAKSHSVCSIPDEQGQVQSVLVGVDEDQAVVWTLAGAARKLTSGVYRLDTDRDAAWRTQASVGWGLGAYRFDRYKPSDKPQPALYLPDDVDADEIMRQVDATALVRDLVNTPAQDMMPEHLAEAARMLADAYDAEFGTVEGDALLDERYPCIHAVGRASQHTPRKVELTWGSRKHPVVTLVGKGVCFDSGGLDIKPAGGMRHMKKDMGGAAHALGLAQLIMSAKLPVRLRVLIGAVENAISGDAFRPGDVLASRKGLSIEIENTDAEGRLVLCDLLTAACEGKKKPAVLVDFATLTGAARVAVGTEIAACFTDDDALFGELQESAVESGDPVWRLPLHAPYRSGLDSQIADIANCGSSSYGGAITAALFLKEFVEPDVPWIHFDIMAWNTRTRPGRPKGGEAMGMRAMFEVIRKRFSR
ncbi:leucyl aminopeptidase [Thioalkalivibrio denitrificans]|uniref:Leucyl aminopeptidase n=1 Tax=Thioalkalivibrio denitrificans TaxID=108003 RepID=A0A1V3NRM7_9GAMM|nr:leucyl aminopeptidase family protein [Thioalkalivibrio denitrificans]OOG27664.1 leucyl aminopeptidase [Thioalkalivibrio denitrificans]